MAIVLGGLERRNARSLLEEVYVECMEVSSGQDYLSQ